MLPLLSRSWRENHDVQQCRWCSKQEASQKLVTLIKATVERGVAGEHRRGDHAGLSWSRVRERLRHSRRSEFIMKPVEDATD
jgi:hypothetical protein